MTTPIHGRLSDLYGRRPVLLISIALFVAASVLCALSQTMPELIAARVLQGVGGGGLRSVSQAAIADVIPPRERGRYQGYFRASWRSRTAGPGAGRVLCPISDLAMDLLDQHPVRCLGAFVLCNRNLRRLPRPRRKPAIDWLGAVLILAVDDADPDRASAMPSAAGGWGRIGGLVPIAVGIVLVGT